MIISIVAFILFNVGNSAIRRNLPTQRLLNSRVLFIYLTPQFLTTIVAKKSKINKQIYEVIILYGLSIF
ncbi:MAG TPA: hypothetical protein ENL00_03835 [Nitratifractor sp.]|nr:hypothetical protein [Nitratifractor sp.]